jgi:hypothetical protein
MLCVQGSEQRLEDTAELQNAAPRSPGAIVPPLHTNAGAESEHSGLGLARKSSRRSLPVWAPASPRVAARG